MANSNLSGGTAGLPPQKLPESKKDEAWVKRCIDALQNYSQVYTENNRSLPSEKRVNYDLMNSHFDEDDFQYVLNPYNVADQGSIGTPARMENYNIVAPKINLLLGEELARPLDFRVIAVSGDEVSERKKELKEAVVKSLKKLLKHHMEPEIDPTTGQPKPPEAPHKVKKRMQRDYVTSTERTMNMLLEYLSRKEEARRKFSEGWYDALVAGEEVYYVGITGGKPFFRRVNPINFDYDKNPEVRRIEDGQWAREDRWMLPAEIIDDYGEFLTEDEIDKIEQGNMGFRRPAAGHHHPGYAYKDTDFSGRSNSRQANYGYNGHYIQVTVAVWKSFRKIGFLTYIDEEGRQQMDVVDEKFKMNDYLREEEYEIEWQWVSEVWKGVKIGNDIYVDYGPLPNQNRDPFDVTGAKLPYVGHTYNEVNSRSTSMVDLIKPYQYLYNIIWYRLELELAKADGKKFIMDLAQIPRTEGLDMDSWMYYFKNTGIAFINSMEEGRDGTTAQGQLANFNGFTSIDMTASQAIGQYISVLSKIEQNVDQLTGVSRQREGAIDKSETATGVQSSISQSHYITESYFYQHNEVKKHVMEQLLNAARLAYIDGEEIQHISEEGDVALLQIDGAKINLSEFGLFMTNDSEDNAIREEVRSLASVALQNGVANFSDVIEIFKARSLSKVEELIRNSEKEAKAREEKMQERQAQQAQQQERMKQQAEQEKMQRESLDKQLDRENDLRIAMIKAAEDPQAAAHQQFMEENRDYLERLEKDRNYYLEQQKIQQEERQKNLEAQKLQQEARQSEREARLKEKEIETDLKIAKENKNRYDV